MCQPENQLMGPVVAPRMVLGHARAAVQAVAARLWPGERPRQIVWV